MKPGQVISHRRTASLPDEVSQYRHEGSPNTTGYGSSSDSDSDPSNIAVPARAASAAPSSQQRRMLHASTGSFTLTTPQSGGQGQTLQTTSSQSHRVHHQRRASASLGRRADSPTIAVPERPQSSLGLSASTASQLEAAQLENQLLLAELQRTREQLRLAQSAPRGKAWAFPANVHIRVPFL